MKFAIIFLAAAGLLQAQTRIGAPRWLPRMTWTDRPPIHLSLQPGQRLDAAGVPMAFSGVTAIRVEATFPISIGFEPNTGPTLFPDNYSCHGTAVTKLAALCEVQDASGPLVVQDDRGSGSAPNQITVRWATLRIADLDLVAAKWGGGNAGSPPAAVAAPAGPAVSQIGQAVFEVPPGRYVYFQFTVPDAVGLRNYVRGRFQAQGGNGNDIAALILNADGFINFQNGHQAAAFYSSNGNVTVGNISVGPLPQGIYYIVFSNLGSVVSNKIVRTDLFRVSYPNLAR